MMQNEGKLGEILYNIVLVNGFTLRHKVLNYLDKLVQILQKESYYNHPTVSKKTEKRDSFS